MVHPPPETTADSLLGGRLRLHQAARGHRAGSDALMLAALTPPQTRGLILDIGASAGAVGLVAALRAPQAQVGLVEIDPASCALARLNIQANALEGRMCVYETDVVPAACRRAAGLVDEMAELVLTNPPFFEAGAVRITPDADKARAHVAAVPLAEWVRASLALLAPGGVFAMIHRADALAHCLSAIGGRLGALTIRPVQPRAGVAATRILLRGVKGSKAPLTLAAPFILHEQDGQFTTEARQIGEGAPPDWFFG